MRKNKRDGGMEEWMGGGMGMLKSVWGIGAGYR
jgi:hypothetical protein